MYSFMSDLTSYSNFHNKGTGRDLDLRGNEKYIYLWVGLSNQKFSKLWLGSNR